MIRSGRRLLRWLTARLAVGVLLSTSSLTAVAQAPPEYPSASAYPLPVDRGAAAVWQSLRRLHTRASLIMIVAHPDDEDGGMLTYEARGQGVDTSLLTLNRGEGGQNVMSADYWDQLGLVRTEELLAAGQYYGVHQYFSRVADFGFSKTIDEAMKTWGHDRVLYDAVRVVRLTRPLVVTSSFTGNVADGHGQHQVSGAIAQEVFKAAADPDVFPDQIKAGLLPWAPLKVYARVPFARVTSKGIYDYATGHWAPVEFRNYVDGTVISGVPPATVSIPAGQYDPLLGQSYFTLARAGLAQQKSQNGGVGVPNIGPVFTPYHLYASRVSPLPPSHEDSFFDGIDTSLAGIASYLPPSSRKPWQDRLNQLNAIVERAIAGFDPNDPAKIAPLLAAGLAQTNDLLASLAASDLAAAPRYNMSHELLIKQRQFNGALCEALGVSVLATVNAGEQGASQTVVPGQTFGVSLHIAVQGSQPISVTGAHLESQSGPGWIFAVDTPVTGPLDGGSARDENASVTVPENAEPTRPYFSRPNIEQSYYDIADPLYLNQPTAPYPLSAALAFTFNGVSAHAAGVVQVARRIPERGPVFEPLLVAPPISLTVSPQAGVVPLTNASLHLEVTVLSNVKGAASGTVRLKLPDGWKSNPEAASFATSNDGDVQTVAFEVTPKSVAARPYIIQAVADYRNRQYLQGFQWAGYSGLRPYPYYRDATYRIAGVDVKVAPQLRVGYIMGTGDDVARSMEDLCIHATMLTAQDVAAGDLSGYDAIVLGIRTYAARPELKAANIRLLEYVKNGGVVIVQYQTAEYDHNYGPYSLTLSGDAEKVIEEDSKVTLLAPHDPVFTWPNRITADDFNGWIEERGHGFMQTWDPRYTALTEMHDADQDPQKGGLLYAHYGRGAYVYMAYAFFRQMPDGVPGSFRIFANLVSLGKNPAFQAAVPSP